MTRPDITKTGEVAALVETPHELRDDAWLAAFFAAVVHAAFAPGEPQVLQGPDGFPYVVLRTPEPHQPVTGYSIAGIAAQATQRGFGVVLNPGEQGADWVFSYGDLVEYRLTGELRLHPAPDAARPETEAVEGEKVLLGAPSDTYLPEYARRALAEHLRRIGIEHPAALLMSRHSGESSLVFPMTPRNFATEEEFRYVMGSIAWFLPRGYSIVAMEPESFPAGAFFPLDRPAPAPAAAPAVAPPPAPAQPEPAAAPPAPVRPPRAERAAKPPKKPWYRRLF